MASAIFLNTFKGLLEQGLVEMDARNQKTPDFMREYALSFDDVKEILKGIDPSEVYEGPSKDYNGSRGEVMIFLHDYDRIKLYIKLKIVTLPDGKTGAVLSIHKEGLYD